MEKSFVVGDIVTWDSTVRKTQGEAISQYIDEIGAGPTYTITKLIDVDTLLEATESTKYFFVQVNGIAANFSVNWFQRAN